MSTQLRCGACDNVIPDEESIYAIRVMQVVHAICEACKNKIPRQGRIPQDSSSMSGRASINPNVIAVHIAMRDKTKQYGIDLGEIRLRVSKHVLQKKWPNICFNSAKA